MTTVREEHGNLLEADVDALVNTVNTVGVMGKGIALQFKRAFPAMFKDYEKAAKAGEVHLGRMHVFPTGALDGPRFIVNFPTKGHWRAKSRLADVRAGLSDLVATIGRLGIRSIAIPPLGCGNGGLRWEEVQPLIVEAFAMVPEVDVVVFPPEGAPAAVDMVDNTPRPNMTVGKAALVEMIDRYAAATLDVSLIEVHKLMYFLQAAGEPLNLTYVKDLYGPYADNLRHVLRTVEGHFLVGYGDASSTVHAAEPIRALPDAVAEAAAILNDQPDTRIRIDRVLELVEGFESPYALELLATVHWITADDSDAAADPRIAAKVVGDWSTRKRRMFGPDHVTNAWNRLQDLGWIRSSVPA